MTGRVLRAGLAAAFLAIAAAGAGAQAQTAVAAAPSQDWSRTIARTAEGGVRMGNPAAQVKLIEYASISCPHCAEYARERAGALVENYVRAGRVSWEYRPFVIFPTDPAIFQLLLCGDEQTFFQRVEQLYSSQEEWAGRVTALKSQRLEQIESLTGSAHSTALVEAMQLDRFFRASGMDEAAIQACLADEAALSSLGERSEQAMTRDNVAGTPAFLINGNLHDVVSWAELEPLLQAALEP
ncbi:MAG: DsbA family protein [Allosphingosinicella sp.]